MTSPSFLALVLETNWSVGHAISTVDSTSLNSETKPTMVSEASSAKESQTSARCTRQCGNLVVIASLWAVIAQAVRTTQTTTLCLRNCTYLTGSARAALPGKERLQQTVLVGLTLCYHRWSGVTGACPSWRVAKFAFDSTQSSADASARRHLLQRCNTAADIQGHTPRVTPHSQT